MSNNFFMVQKMNSLTPYHNKGLTHDSAKCRSERFMAKAATSPEMQNIPFRMPDRTALRIRKRFFWYAFLSATMQLTIKIWFDRRRRTLPNRLASCMIHIPMIWLIRQFVLSMITISATRNGLSNTSWTQPHISLVYVV